LQIRAYDPKKPKDDNLIGSASFTVKTDRKGNSWLESDDTKVIDEYRGKGVAALMYTFAKSLGNDIKPSPYQSAAGNAMWKKWGSDAKNLAAEDRHPNDTPYGPEFKPTMPAGTVRVDVSDVYDWYKLGQHISNLNGLGHHDFGQGPPSTIFSFGSEEEEHKYIDALKKTGLTTTDIDPLDPNPPKGMPPQKVDPTFNVNEAFDQPYPFKWEKGEFGDLDALAQLDDGSYLSIMFNKLRAPSSWMVEFYRNNSQEVTGEGDAHRVFATVLKAIGEFITKAKPKNITFSSVKEADPKGTRAKLYDRLVQKYAGSLGYSVTKNNHPDETYYDLKRLVKTNQADVTETDKQSSAKSAIYQTEVFGAKAYHSKCLEPGCDWESRRFDRIKQAQDAAKKHSQTHFKPNMVEGVNDNFLYHATQPAGIMRILRTGAIKASNRPQIATKAKTQYPTISTTRSKQYAESDDFVDFLNLTKEGNTVILVFDRNAIANHYKMFSTSQGTQTVGDEFEEAIVVPKGAMPINGTLKGFYFNPNRQQEVKEFENVPWFKELLDSPYYMGSKQGVAENFADGRNPQDKGDSKRYNVPTKASVSTLRKIAKQGGRRGQLAHWMANMKSGKQK
jgi:hypothetical protein